MTVHLQTHVYRTKNTPGPHKGEVLQTRPILGNFTHLIQKSPPRVGHATTPAHRAIGYRLADAVTFAS